MPALDIETLRQTPQARTVLTLHTPLPYPKKQWESWVQEDFQVGVSADFSAPFEDFLEDYSRNIGQAKVLGAMASDTNVPFADKLQSINIDSARTTQMVTYTWVASDRPSFNATLVFISASRSDVPQYEVVSLAKLTQPRVEGVDTMQAPAGYRAGGRRRGGTGAPDGTFTLEIGNWFEASGLVLRDAQMVISPQRMSNSQPLYAEVAVTLEPYRLIDEREFESYFRIRGERAVLAAG